MNYPSDYSYEYYIGCKVRINKLEGEDEDPELRKYKGKEGVITKAKPDPLGNKDYFEYSGTWGEVNIYPLDDDITFFDMDWEEFIERLYNCEDIGNIKVFADEVSFEQTAPWSGRYFTIAEYGQNEWSFNTEILPNLYEIIAELDKEHGIKI